MPPDIEALDRVIRGDGDKPGLTARVVALEREAEARLWQVRMLTAAVVSVAIKAILDMMQGLS